MIRAMSLQEVQKVTGGVIMNAAETAFNSVSIDTRTLQPNDLFIAISGPNFNGNKFVSAAVLKKAKAAIISEDLEIKLPVLKVNDTRIALGQIGAMNRGNSTACVIALTGSQGKTTVKEMVAKILSQCGDVHHTKGNLNNDFGVPLSLLEINAQHDFSVIEIGASGPGEVAYCVALAKPQVAHITNVAATHLEGFGDIEGVARAKGELWNGIKDGGVAVINIDDAFADQWRQSAKRSSIISISAEGNVNADYYVENVELNTDLSAGFTLHTPAGIEQIHIKLAGKHNVANALAAAALSMEAGANLKDVKNGLKLLMPVPGRMCNRPGLNSSIIIDDTYNASPASFRAAIDVLCALPGKKMLVIGDMGELGAETETAHSELGIYAREKGVDELFATGKLSKLAADNFGSKAIYKPERDLLVQHIIPALKEGVTLLVKGSRSMGMEKLVQLLIEKEGNP